MGHVDHGKTRLLDAIRKTNVVAGEAGGITQHIGAYQVATTHEGQERAITFIDTPGHEAFTAMRARGAKVTDIAILVVAADDGVMPQTIEALNHAQAADVPIVVAVNKIDKEGANPEKVRQQLTEYGLVAEEYGGDTMFVDVSAKQGTNIDELLEAVLLTADAALDLRANADKDARGVAIEAHLDKGRGPVATVLVQSRHAARRRLDRRRRRLTAASARCSTSTASTLDGGGSVAPGAGARSDLGARRRRHVPRGAATTAPPARSPRSVRPPQRAALAGQAPQADHAGGPRRGAREGKIDTLNLILKGDVSGSVEALEDALLKIDVGEEVHLRVIHRGVGAITENDVNLASASDAIIIGFNVRPGPSASTSWPTARAWTIRYYSVIYQAIEEIEAALKGMLKPEYEEVQLGTAEVREVFRSSKFGNIAGCIVRSG